MVKDFVNVLAEYETSYSIREVAEKTHHSYKTVRRILISFGYYNNEIIRKINRYYEECLDIRKTAKEFGLTVALVRSYIPYNIDYNLFNEQAVEFEKILYKYFYAYNSPINEVRFFKDVCTLTPAQITKSIMKKYLDSGNIDELKNDCNLITRYIYRIIVSKIGLREKIPILLSCLERYIVEKCFLDMRKAKHLSKSNAKQSLGLLIKRKCDADSISRTKILWICNVVYASISEEEIDSMQIKFPFRHYILHNGMFHYSNVEIEQMYKILKNMIYTIYYRSRFIKKNN